jgi:hypothetical protein
VNPSDRERTHWTGPPSSRFTPGLALLVSALLRGGVDGWTSVATLATGTAGLALLGGFAAIERAKRAAAMPTWPSA